MRIPHVMRLSPALLGPGCTSKNFFRFGARAAPTTSCSASTDAASEQVEKYVPPRVWTMGEEAQAAQQSKWSGNLPTAGARFDQELPKGDRHSLQLHSLATPNGQKITIMLEELLAAGHTGAEYDAWRIDIMKGDQFGSGFVDLNPNSKIPALLDYGADAETPVKLFESGSILLYLAEKFDNAFYPTALQTAIRNWLFWQVGSAPYLGGGFGHFYAYAPEKFEYPINRFTMETKRQLDVLNRQLAKQEHMCGDEYTIADIAIFPWYGKLVLGDVYGSAKEFLNVDAEYPHVIEWAKRIASRPAVQRGQIVNKVFGDKPHLAERHDAADIDAALLDVGDSE